MENTILRKQKRKYQKQEKIKSLDHFQKKPKERLPKPIKESTFQKNARKTLRNHLKDTHLGTKVKKLALMEHIGTTMVK